MNRIAASPELYPQRLDLIRKRVLMIRMAEADYRTASFLDHRLFTSDREGLWIDIETLFLAAADVQAKPLHFIFHTGHVGSTLLSRLLDETSDVLSLREPLPLRIFADLFDRLEPNLLRDRALEAFLNLWSRGYRHTEAVVLKATSNTARFGTNLLEAQPNARAVYLSMAARPTIEVLLSTRSSVADMKSMEDERLQRLSKLLPESDIRPPQSLGELAAITWIAERLTRQKIETLFGERVLDMDFERFLEDPQTHLERVLKHLELQTNSDHVAAAMQSPLMTQYSKQPQYPYSLEVRAQRLAKTRSEHAEDIALAHAWLEALASRSAEVAEVL